MSFVHNTFLEVITWYFFLEFAPALLNLWQGCRRWNVCSLEQEGTFQLGHYWVLTHPKKGLSLNSVGLEVAGYFNAFSWSKSEDDVYRVKGALRKSCTFHFILLLLFFHPGTAEDTAFISLSGDLPRASSVNGLRECVWKRSARFAWKKHKGWWGSRVERE